MSSVSQDNRFRLMFKFWLDMNNDHDYALADEIDKLKQDRGFVPAIRQGLRLLLALRRRDLSVLREMFPWVWDAIAAEIAVPTNDEVLRSVDALHRRLDEGLPVQLISAGIVGGQGPGNGGYSQHPALPPGGGMGRALRPPLPTDDDDDLITETESSSDDTADNFLAAIQKLKPRKASAPPKLDLAPIEMPVFDDDEDLIG